jgi:signal transduction histidine kinase
VKVFRAARELLPAALALLFQGGFAVAVMALDRANRGLESNLGYVIAVELASLAAFLGAIAFARARTRRELAAAIERPLEAGLPPARLASDESWRELLAATRAAAARELALREASARSELDAFLAEVHALKTPATALSLMAERAFRTGEPMPADGARLEVDELDRILDRALARLRLLDFDKGSRFRRFDAAALVKSSLRKHRRLFIARGLSCEVVGCLEADSDPDWVAFILDQLLSNAAKHASSRASVELGASGAAAWIEVADDGPGFGPEEALRAFSRSAAGIAAAEGLPSSSGYGLYLAKEAARRLGASLEIMPGEGARIRLSLPFSPGPFGELSRM